MLFYAWVAFAAILILSVVIAAVMANRDSSEAINKNSEDEAYDPGGESDADSMEAEMAQGDAEPDFAAEEVGEFAEFEEDFK